MHHQARVDLLYFLGNQTKLRDTIFLGPMFIAESHRLERENGIARLVHRLDIFLEPSRRRDDPELAGGGIDDDMETIINHHIVDPGHERPGLYLAISDADGVGLTSHSRVTDINVVTAGSKIDSGETAQGNIRGASAVVIEGERTFGGVLRANGILTESRNAVGSVIIAAGIGVKC